MTQKPYLRAVTSAGRWHNPALLSAFVSRQQFAEALVYKKLIDDKARDLELLYGRYFQPFGAPITLGLGRKMLGHIEQAVGFQALEAENCGFEWSARVCGTGQGGKELRPDPAFIRKTADCVLAADEICGLTKTYDHWRLASAFYQTSMVGLAVVVGTPIGAVLLPQPFAALMTYELLRNALFVACASGAVSLPIATKIQFAFPDLEHKAESVVVDQWLATAQETGDIQISMRDKLFGLEGSREKFVRRCTEKSIKWHAQNGVSFRRIDDIIREPKVNSLRILDDALSTRIYHFGERGIIFEVTSTNPVLAGTCLQIVAHPDERSSPKDNESGTDRMKKKGFDFGGLFTSPGL